MIKTKQENNIINTLDNNIIMNENELDKRQFTNSKSKPFSNSLKLQPGEIYYSDNLVNNDFNKKSYLHNNLFLTSSREISNRDDNTLNRKIFSIINSSGTEEDENSGINIVIQNPNYLIENNNNHQFKKTNHNNIVNNIERSMKLDFQYINRKNLVNPNEDESRNNNNDPCQNKPLTDREVSSQRTRRQNFENLIQPKVVAKLTSNLKRKSYKNSIKSNSMNEIPMNKANNQEECKVSNI